MQVTLNIESGQLGETVIDLFKNLTAEKKEELALAVLREWLKDPEFIETRTRDAVLIDEFRTGKRQPSWSYNKYDQDTPEEKIRRDENFQNAMKQYKSSKALLIEDIKAEVVEYYKKHICAQLEQTDAINKARDEAMQIIKWEMPQIVNKALVNMFSQSLANMQSNLVDSLYENMPTR